MARSNRRRRRASASTANPRSYSNLHTRSEHTQTVEEAPAPAEKPAAPPTAARVRSSSRVDWKDEYGQVFSDLRNLLIISVVLFAVMLILGFVI